MNRRDALKSAAAIGLFSFGLTRQSGVMAQDATPPAGETEATLDGLYASNVDSLPTANAGEVQVVAHSAPLEKEVGFIVHNNTDQVVEYAGVIGVARDQDDKLVGVLNSEYVAPFQIEPGHYSIGIATFDKALPADTKIELVPEFVEPGSSWRASLNLTVTEVAVDDESIVGIVENQTGKDATSLSSLIGLFLNDEGEIVGVTRGYLDSTDLADGEFSTFNMFPRGGETTESCLFAASGREDR